MEQKKKLLIKWSSILIRTPREMKFQIMIQLCIEHTKEIINVESTREII